jgi:hypothetical protein
MAEEQKRYGIIVRTIVDQEYKLVTYEDGTVKDYPTREEAEKDLYAQEDSHVVQLVDKVKFHMPKELMN